MKQAFAILVYITVITLVAFAFGLTYGIAFIIGGWVLLWLKELSN